MARVLIVAKTRMGDYYTCVGGLNLDTNESVRLLGPDNSNQPSNAPFNVGQIWDIEYIQRHNIDRPHVEDVIVQSYQYKEQLTNLKETLMQRVQPWRGGINQLFGGLLTLQNEKAYISKNKELPHVSTGYWIPDKPLWKGSTKQRRLSRSAMFDETSWRREPDDKIYYISILENQPYEIKHVGFADPIRQIPAGTLVRISLARWLQPYGASEERCYLQISGWYM